MTTVTPSAAVLKSGYRGFRFTQHALDRMEEMGLRWNEVLDAVREPRLDYPSAKYPHARIAVKGTIAVAYSAEDKAIITVLWDSVERWERPGNESDG